MAQVYLSIGSNIDREHNIRSCLRHLEKAFGEIILSTLYETEAVGFDGDHFINLATGFTSNLSPKEIDLQLKEIENKHLRTREGSKFSARTLDIDLLLYDQLILHPDMDIPRNEITKYAFVLFPLAEIAADFIHPEYQQSIAELAKQSSLNATSLKPITI